ncbi:hypothetical protein [Megasphaera sp.]|uniref:hypothetical protein n=1 Tax=Megasphaera sp. TaxID=2023260 RepID=UPI00351FA0B9
MWKKKAACILAVMAVCGTMAAGAADYTILEKADKVETTVYGTTQTGSLNERIASLDKLLNGQSTVSGSLENKTNALYKDVYGNSGSDLSLLTAVNLMQWQYSGQITDEPLLSRVESLEQSIDGKTMSGSLEGRVWNLRHALLGNKKYISQTVTIPANTLVTMTNIDSLDSKTAQQGDVVRFAVAEDIMVGDVIAIPRGMEASGTITKARKSGRFGKDGKIEITYDNVRAADGSPVALTVGDKTKEEYKRTAGAVGASAAGAIILGPVGLVGGLFVHGNEVNIPSGTTMYAETKANAEVVGFKENGVMDDMKTANMAASGVAVPTFSPVTNNDVDTSGTADSTADAPQSSNGDLQEGLKNGSVTPVDLDNHPANSDAQPVVTIQSNTSGDANE